MQKRDLGKVMEGEGKGEKEGDGGYRWDKWNSLGLEMKEIKPC